MTAPDPARALARAGQPAARAASRSGRAVGTPPGPRRAPGAVPALLALSGLLASALMASGLLASPALAQQGKLADVKRGSEFSASCQPGASETQKAYLAGFVMGVADASVGKHLCPKEAVTTQQLVDVFCKYLGEHPKNQNRPGGLLLGLALSETWRCKP
ncbi:Rap1a/Tai family immunity protein [Methylobacterium crusticola]|uniref:Rap1a/Tai family immunity protein n=1 Tax=Methylobacterium crusticola TaxID=1697972 RepID=UPI001EE37C92|nr:Rap1a/Tai family immunity protein [Methylobacterium crusticola]